MHSIVNSQEPTMNGTSNSLGLENALYFGHNSPRGKKFTLAISTYQKKNIIVLTKTQNDLKQLTTILNDLKRRKNDLKHPRTLWNDLQPTRNDLKQPTTSKKQPTTVWTYQKREKKDVKPPPTSRFQDYITVLDNRFSSLTRFLPNIWWQSLEHCFMENES